MKTTPMNPDITQRILNEIENKQLKPHPRWHTQLKKSGVWVVGIGLVFCAGLGIGTIASIVQTSDWELYRHNAPVPPAVMLLLLSYAWVLLVAGALAGVYYACIHTGKGYRYPLHIIILVSGSVAVILGGTVFITGVGHRVDQRFEDGVPFYGRVISPRHHLLFNPDEGRLTGRVQSVEVAQEEMTLVDPFAHVWIVELEDTDAAFNDVQRGFIANVIGTKIDEDTFRASDVRFHPRPPVGALMHRMMPQPVTP